MQTIIPPRVKVRLNDFIACVIHDAADTDVDGIIASLTPAVNDLYEHMPAEAHESLTKALISVAVPYDLATEMADVAARCQRRAAGQDDDSDDDGLWDETD